MTTDTETRTGLIDNSVDGRYYDNNNLDSDDVSEKGIMVTTTAYRLFFAIIGSFGVMMNTASRAIVSVTIVAMTDDIEQPSLNNTSECFPETLSTVSNSSFATKAGNFNWDSKTQGLILSAFAYGYLITQIPAGLLAGKFGGKRIYGICILASGVMNLLVPTGAHAGVGVMFSIQVMTGLFLGATTPSMQSMIGRITPIMERSRLFSLVFQGSPMGTLLALPIAGALCNSNFLGGWPSVYYIFGAIPILWSIPWFVFVKDTSDNDMRKENCLVKSKHTPWKSVLTSSAVWGICLAHLSYGWMFFTMTTYLPTYLTTVLKFDISSSGIVAALPFLVSWFCQFIAGGIADFMRKRKYLSTLAARKLCTLICFVVPAASLVSIYYAGCDRVFVLVLLSLAQGFAGFCVAGFLVNGVDIASNYAGEIMGLSNTLSTVCGIIAPTIIGIIIEGNPSREQWQIVFTIAAGINIGGALVFIILGKGAEQSWNRNDSSEKYPEHFISETTRLLR